jgi:hypothetical protein
MSGGAALACKPSNKLCAWAHMHMHMGAHAHVAGFRAA